MATVPYQIDPFAGIDIPEAFHGSLLRHRENLAQLIASLRSVGLSDVQIEDSVSVMVESYKKELLQAIKEMVK